MPGEHLIDAGPAFQLGPFLERRAREDVAGTLRVAAVAFLVVQAVDDVKPEQHRNLQPRLFNGNVLQSVDLCRIRHEQERAKSGCRQRAHRGLVHLRSGLGIEVLGELRGLLFRRHPGNQRIRPGAHVFSAWTHGTGGLGLSQLRGSDLREEAGACHERMDRPTPAVAAPSGARIIWGSPRQEASACQGEDECGADLKDCRG